MPRGRYHADSSAGFRLPRFYFRQTPTPHASMNEGLFHAGLWHQLVQLWELIVLVCHFVWELLRFLGGG
jgi:hypothetical protein